MSRPDWLNLYKDWTEQSESPTSFHEACALSTLAAVVERRVWVDQGVGQLFPNLYMILVGPPATRKSTAALKAQSLMTEIPGIVLAPDNITKEAMYGDMEGNAMKIFKHRAGKYVHTSYTAVATEWSMFLGEKDNKFLMALIKLFDCEEQFQYVTKTAGKNYLKNVFFNMLGCIQPQMIPQVLPHAAIGSGFTSRLIMVVENQKRGDVPRPRFPKKLKQELIDALMHISGSFGEFTFDAEAQAFMDEWYLHHEDGNILSYDDRFKSYIHRKPVHATKLALLMSLSRSYGTEHRIRIGDIQRAVEWLDSIEGSMADAYGAFGLSEDAHVANTILSMVRDRGTVTSDEILAACWRDMNYAALVTAVQTLTQAGLIESRSISGNRLQLKILRRR